MTRRNAEAPAPSPLAEKIICLDPGHGGTADTDHYRVGPAGEREEWINLRVALALRDLLTARGAHVIMTREGDDNVALKARAYMAVAAGADVLLSIHHNATADRTVNFPIIYYHANASENPASVRLGQLLGRELHAALFDPAAPVSVVSDHTIFPGAGAAVLRHSYGIPGVIGEASFFSNIEEEQQLKDPDYNQREAEAYLAALDEFFRNPAPPALEKYSTIKIEPFAVAQEADRMNPEALEWMNNFKMGEARLKSSGAAAAEEALVLFTQSARFFPDSPVARRCHLGRAEALRRLGRPDEAAAEECRVAEFYPQ